MIVFKSNPLVPSPQDGSGAISHTELLGVMRAMGQNPTEDELLNMILEVDMDGNGTIEFSEFLELMKTKANEVEEKLEDENYLTPRRTMWMMP